MGNNKKLVGLPANAGVQTIKDFISKNTWKYNGCWFWQKDSFPSGYGYMRIGGSAFSVRRVVWFLIHDYVPKGERMSDTCGQKNCHNPDHLIDRTDEDDKRTTLFKGGVSGFNTSRLKEEKIAEIWDLLLFGDITIKKAAKQCGTSVTTMRKHLYRYEEKLSGP